MQKLSLLFLLLAVLPFANIHAEESNFNAGIVQGLWYSQEKFFADEPIRIYVAIRNNTGSDLTGTVEFFDGEKRLERKNVQALDGRIIESWSDWEPEYGTHTLSANLSRTELFTVGSTTQEVDVISVRAKDTVFVDYDTDKDDIGNLVDTDDDGDSISDTQEKANGTNPLVKDVTVETTASQESTTQRTDSADGDTPDEKETTKRTNNNSSNDGPQGLEQYLAPSPAEVTLSGITSYITKAKTSLDSYREERNEKREAKETATAQSTVNADGFGEVERNTEAEKKKFSLPKFDGGGFLDKLFNGIGKLVSSIYTLLLATVSFILGHPIFVQMGLLILILYLLIRTARKFGRRPKKR